MDRTILVPFDGSAHSRAGLEYTLEEYPDADVTVLHVVELTRALSEDGERALEEVAQWLEGKRADATKVLEEAEEIAAERDRHVRTVRWVGQPAKAILEYASEEDVDHVVIGSRGQTDDESGRLGSVAESVVHRAPVLVTVIR